jgi:HlyD family secretion protein
VRIVIWEASDVLKVPSSAAFRHGEGWSAFVVENGVAQLRAVEIGRRTPQDVQILTGLAEHEQVIVHPSNQIENGTRVNVR